VLHYYIPHIFEIENMQTGCGRVGDYFWAFKQQGVVPDLVTIVKPIGNGHPLGVVVTTKGYCRLIC